MARRERFGSGGDSTFASRDFRLVSRAHWFFPAVMTTANKITIFRILLIPFFVVAIVYYGKTGVEWLRLTAVLTFATASILDGVDGYIARHYNQRSELGTILDPLADKLLLVAAVVVLSFDFGAQLGQIPFWLTGTIIGRDIVILIGMVVIHLTIGKVRARPHLTGKIATVFQMGAVIWILLKWDAALGERWLLPWTIGAGRIHGNFRIALCARWRAPT